MDILLEKYARRTTCLYEIVSKIVLACCSFRKADAKVDVLQLPTKQKRNFFPEFFVNKYNSLTTKEVQPYGRTSFIYAYVYITLQRELQQQEPPLQEPQQQEQPSLQPAYVNDGSWRPSSRS